MSNYWNIPGIPHNVTFNMHFTDQNTFDKLQDFCREKNEENFDRLQLEIGNILC
jgi:hypothetical protein